MQTWLPADAEFVASRDPGLIAAGALMYALLGVLLLAAAFYLVWVSVHRTASSKAHFVKVAEHAPAVKVPYSGPDLDPDPDLDS